MYGIFTYIWVIYGVNVGKYAIHGSYGLGESSNHSWPKLRQGFQAMEGHQGPTDRRQNRHGGLLHGDTDRYVVTLWRNSHRAFHSHGGTPKTLDGLFHGKSDL
jgi:hypothetical protein